MSAVIEAVALRKPRAKLSKAQLAKKRAKRRMKKKGSFVLDVSKNSSDKNRINTLSKELKDLRIQTNMLGKKIREGMEPKYAKYALTIMDPSNHMSRIPDAYNQPTALYKSVQTIPIKLNYSANPSGQFAILVKPNIGLSAASSAGFQIMYSKPDCNNLSDDTQYNYVSDPQADIFYSNLGGEWFLTTGNPATAGLLVPTQSAEFATTLVYSSLFDTIVTHNAGSSVSVHPFITGASPVSFLSYTGKTNQLPTDTEIAIYKGLSGWHMVSVCCSYQGSQASISTKGYFLFGRDVVGSTLTPVMLIGASTPIYYNPDDQSRIHIESNDQFVANLYSNAQGLMWRVNFYYNFQPDKNYYISGTFSTSAPGTTDRAQQNVTFTKVNSPTLPSTSTFIPTLRPVAQSAILTNVAPNLYKGGVMACMSCIKGEVEYFTNSESDFSSRDISGITKIGADATGRLNTTMPAAKGAYSFVLPYQSVGETAFVDVNTLNANDYGGIVFCGSVEPISGVSLTTVFYLKVVTIFEYYTPSRLIETKIYSGNNTKAIEAIQKIIEGNSIIFENPLHIQGIQDMIMSALSPIYGLSRLTGTDPKQNFEKFGKVASGLLKSAPSADSVMDLLPLLAGLL